MVILMMITTMMTILITIIIVIIVLIMGRRGWGGAALVFAGLRGLLRDGIV